MCKTLVIKAEKVYKEYQAGERRIPVLRGVDLEIHDGEFVALMGDSGSGKSTLMNLLGCLDRPSQGKYFFCGRDIGKLDRDELAEIRNQKIGFVFQGFNLLRRTSAIDNVQLPLVYSPHLGRKQRYLRAERLLYKLGLGDRVQHHPNQLSGGEQQRVAIARALVNEPAVLLADEPTGNLDSKTGLEILVEFQRLNREQGQTIVMVTHNLEVAMCCPRQIKIRDGRIIADHPNTAVRNAAAELAKLETERARVPLEVAS